MTRRLNDECRSCRVCGGTNFTPIYYIDNINIGKCNKCEFIQLTQITDFNSLKKIYSYTNIKDNHPKSQYLTGMKLRAKYFLKYTKLKSGLVLEIGSAQGHFLSLLKKRGFKVLGIEPSIHGAMIHRAKRIPVINDFLENVKLPDGKFDAICLFHVFEHFDDPKHVAKVLHSKLKKGGYIIIEVPDIHSQGARFEKHPHKLFNKHHLSYFSLQSLNGLMNSVGFTKVFAHHYDLYGPKIPFGKSLKKIFYPIIKPDFKGPLEKIIAGETNIYYESNLKNIDHDANKKVKKSKTIFRDFRKSLSYPLNIICNYIAYKLDRGSALLWIGQKSTD